LELVLALLAGLLRVRVVGLGLELELVLRQGLELVQVLGLLLELRLEAVLA
jgi:hypothetical protein